MRRFGIIGIAVCAGAAVLWGLSQVGGEPRFSKVESVQQMGSDGVVITRSGGEIEEQAQDRPTVNAAPGQALGLPVGPTIGPPPSGSHLPNAGEPRDIAPMPGVIPHVSRFASTGAAKWTRIRQILVEAGEDDVAGKISSFQQLLKESRQGSEVSAEELVEAQDALVIEVEGMLTGAEVEELLEDLQAAVDAMKAEESANSEVGEP